MIKKSPVKSAEALADLALVLSLIPFLSFLPPVFAIRISGPVQMYWTFLNLTAVIAAFLLCLFLIRSGKKSWKIWLALIISGFLILLALGISALMLILNFS